MAFHKSSKNIDVVDGHLVATCTDCIGRNQRSELRLDSFLGNRNGFFEWGGGNFSKSARDTTVSADGDSVYLHARLRTQHKSWRDARVNLSDRITNINGDLKYLGGEPQVEHSRDFLGEQTDFLSAAISDTISDLRELFTGSPLFDQPMFNSPRRERTTPRAPAESTRSNDTPLRSERANDSTSASTGPSEFNSSYINLEDSTASIRISTPDKKDEPPAYDAKSATNDKGSSTALDAKVTPEQQDVQDQEAVVLNQIKDFLMNGNGNSVHSSKFEKGKRTFELRGADGSSKTLQIEDRTLFDQDDYRRKSFSEVSDRCMTPSVVDGEDEYDFLGEQH